MGRDLLWPGVGPVGHAVDLERIPEVGRPPSPVEGVGVEEDQAAGGRMADPLTEALAADEGVDYDAGFGTLTFPAGELTKGPETLWDAPGMMRIKIPYGGVTPDGRQIDPEVMPWESFGKFEEDELRGLWQYFQRIAL